MDAGLFGKIDLPPPLSRPQRPDSLADQDANITCHAAMFGLVLALYLVHTLSTPGACEE